jgi:hypothetical protein
MIMLVIILIMIKITKSPIPDPTNTSCVLSEFHEIFVKRPNGYPKMMPTISQIKVIGGIGIEKRSIIGIASITAPITSGIVSLASSFL